MYLVTVVLLINALVTHHSPEVADERTTIVVENLL